MRPCGAGVNIGVGALRLAPGIRHIYDAGMMPRFCLAIRRGGYKQD
jgi:hypothetical protein